MVDISINTPALLFPAITLLMLAYTNRFLAIASRIRSLHQAYNADVVKHITLRQIKNLRARINLIKYMQGFGALSFFGCVLCMYFIYRSWTVSANYIFAISLITLLISIVLSIIEIQQSTKALELELSDMEDLGRSNIFTDIFYSSGEKEID
jgi:cellobiose-specific phosphotransferase system component IIC